MGCGCSWWIVGLTAVAWWLAGTMGGLVTLMITVVVTVAAMLMQRLHYTRLQEVERSGTCGKGTNPCHRCSGTGWLRHDMYNERTCPLCNGSGWEDAPREGIPLWREAR